MNEEPPISPENLRDLFYVLNDTSRTGYRCDGKHTLTVVFLRERNLPVEPVLAWLRSHGACCCDCEVLLNVAAEWGEQVGFHPQDEDSVAEPAKRPWPREIETEWITRAIQRTSFTARWYLLALVCMEPMLLLFDLRRVEPWVAAAIAIYAVVLIPVAMWLVAWHFTRPGRSIMALGFIGHCALGLWILSQLQGMPARDMPVVLGLIVWWVQFIVVPGYVISVAVGVVFYRRLR